MILPVSDIGSNAQENIAHAAKIIGKSLHKQIVFTSVCRGKQQSKLVSRLMDMTGLSRKRVLDAGKMLADNGIVGVTKKNNEICYEKIDFFNRHKKEIMRLALSKEKLDKFPTKRNVKITGNVYQLTLVGSRAKINQISIDQIKSFRRVCGEKTKEYIGDKYSEDEFKQGIKNIIGEIGKYKDWGGEISDLFSTRLNVGNKRIATAFALKGPGVSGKLTPGKMGKNGDQIQRLFEAPAEIFLIQYCRQIDQSVVLQMERLAIAKSLMTGKLIRYGIIDGQDSMRIAMAYSKSFKGRKFGGRTEKR